MSFKQYEYKKPIKNEGCCFCCDCYLAGLNGNNIQEAFDFAVKNNWVRSSDCFVLNHNDLIKGLKEKYGTSGRSGVRVKIIKNKNTHFVVQDGKGNTIYDPA